MTRLNVICEGATEEKFVKDVLAPYLNKRGILVSSKKLGTGSSYGKLKDHVKRWMNVESGAWFTTLVDLYGMGYKFPGYKESLSMEPLQKVVHLEQAFKADMEDSGMNIRRFLPYFQLYEFEALLFSDCSIMEEFLALEYIVPDRSMHRILNQFDSPEHINNSPHTAPSKRIINLIPNYNKVEYGCLIVNAIGLDVIREKCLHFNSWLTSIENIQNKKNETHQHKSYRKGAGGIL